MKLKKILAIGILTMAALSMVSACSKKEKAEESNVSVESTAQETKEAQQKEKAPENYGEIELAEYKGLDVTIEKVEVTDEDVQSEIDLILSSNPEFEEVKDRAAQLGDTVNIDYVGKKDGEAFAGGTASGYDLELGSNQFIPGFEEKLVGAKVGETKNLDLKFPEEYHSEELKGQAVVFEVKVNAIKAKKEAKLTDEFIKNYTQGEFTNVEDFKKDLRAKLEKMKQESAKGQAQIQALQKIMDASKFTLNEEAVKYEVNKIKETYDSMTAMYGMSYEDLAAAYGMTVEDLDKEIQKTGEDFVKQKLTIKSIGEKENIKVDEEDYKKFEELTSQSRKDLEAQYGKEELEETIFNNKVIDFVLESAKK